MEDIFNSTAVHKHSCRLNNGCFLNGLVMFVEELLVGSLDYSDIVFPFRC